MEQRGAVLVKNDPVDSAKFCIMLITTEAINHASILGSKDVMSFFSTHEVKVKVSTSASRVIDGLFPDTRYYFYIMVGDSAGLGPESNVVSLKIQSV